MLQGTVLMEGPALPIIRRCNAPVRRRELFLQLCVNRPLIRSLTRAVSGKMRSRAVSVFRDQLVEVAREARSFKLCTNSIVILVREHTLCTEEPSAMGRCKGAGRGGHSTRAPSRSEESTSILLCDCIAEQADPGWTDSRDLRIVSARARQVKPLLAYVTLNHVYVSECPRCVSLPHVR